MVFCYDVRENPKQIPIDAGELENRKLRELLVRLGQEHKLAFFCNKPLLLEGPSDKIVCDGLNREFDLYLEAAGVQLVPVIGKDQMPTVANLMRLIGKSPMVLADADALADGINLVLTFVDDPNVHEAAQQQGFRDPNAFARTVYDDFCKLVESNWDDIEAHATNHPYWVSRNDELKAKRRAAFATLLSMQESEVAKLGNGDQWAAMRRRLDSLLEILELAGCFILRKGTIESYYLHAAQKTEMGKPSAAVDEVEAFTQEGRERVEAAYDDPLRALRFAAATEPIDEAKALRELLLSVVAPALASLKDQTGEETLRQLARRVIGEKASILKLSTSGKGQEQELIVELNSAVLEVDGFPLRFRKDSNPIVEINRQLGIREKGSRMKTN